MVACLDPYHDSQLECEGLPDERTSPSVVQVHNQRTTLTAPASAAGGTWDASVLYTGINSVMTPTVSSGVFLGGGMKTQSRSAIHSYSHASIPPGMPFGALTLWAGAAGSAVPCGSPITVGDFVNSLGSVMQTDRCRLIGVGFEIHNTTAEVYRQGSLTVAALPDVAVDNGTVTYIDDTEDPDMTTVRQSDRALVFATAVSALQSVPGATTWPAADGVYAIPRLAEIPRKLESYFLTPDDRGGGLTSNTHVPILYGSNGTTATPSVSGFIASSLGGETVAFPSTLAYAPSSFTPIQVMFSGLSNQTSLTVTMRTIVEYFPAVGSQLLPLASPSPAFDPDAFMLYATTIMNAPYAVPVGQNAMGDYFRTVMRFLASAGKEIAAFAGPYAPLVGAGAYLANQLSKLGQPVQKKEAGARARPTVKHR